MPKTLTDNSARARGFRLAILLLITLLLGALIFRISADPVAPHRKVGFIILGDIHAPGWNASNFEGINTACQKLGIELAVRDHVDTHGGACGQAIRELAAEDCGMIFLGSYSYSTDAKDVVAEYPGIAFATNSAEVHTANMTAYFVRMYQARYLSGALAAMRSKTGVIGYVAAMPNVEVNRGINAFTLGVLRINPNARVVVGWTNDWENPQVEKALAERLIRESGADVLTYHQDDAAVAETADKFGVDFIAYNAPIPEGLTHGLAAVRCRWDIFYEDLLSRHMKGELNAMRNHWIGIDRDAVLLSELSPAVTDSMRTRITSLRQELLNQQLIFSGPLYDNRGVLRCREKETISDDTLLENMNWRVRGVTELD